MTLQRRRQLVNLTKPELIGWIIQIEAGLDNTRHTLKALRTKVDPHDGEQTDHGGWEDH